MSIKMIRKNKCKNLTFIRRNIKIGAENIKKLSLSKKRKMVLIKQIVNV